MVSRKQLGRLGEELAKDFLIKSRLIVLSQNIYLKPYGELDFICLDNKEKELVIVEVRSTKATTTEYFDWILPSQKIWHLRRSISILRASEWYSTEKNKYAWNNVRCDLLIYQSTNREFVWLPRII